MTSKAQHTRNLQRAGLPTVDTLTRRILRVWDRASRSDVEAGATWYDDAGDLAALLAGRSGFTVEQCAVVISHLSPRTSWARNIAGAVALLDGVGVDSTGCIGANIDRARNSLDADDPFDSFGPGAHKTLRFARNIAGDRESVTVDVWACRVAKVDPDLLGRRGVYDAVERAYQDAARACGVDPSTMQATTWIVARGGRAA